MNQDELVPHQEHANHKLKKDAMKEPTLNSTTNPERPTIETAIDEAVSLIDPTQPNKEYERAMVELITNLYANPGDDLEGVKIDIMHTLNIKCGRVAASSLCQN